MGCSKRSSKGKFIAIQAYLRKQEKAQINNLTLHLNQLEREQTRPKVSRSKGIINIRTEINEIERKKTIEKINETKTWILEKINKIDKTLARLIKKKKREQTRPKVSRSKGIINIRTEINEIERKKTIEKINETKTWILEKINKIDKTLARLIKKKKRGLKSIKLEMKKEK